MRSSSFALALAGFSFMATLIWAPPFLRILRHFKIAERIQVLSTGMDFTHLGTPSMGGLLVIVPVTLITLFLNVVTLVGVPLTGRSILLPLAVMLGFGALGVVSDWRHLQGILRGGLPARVKLVIQVLMAVPVAYGVWAILQAPEMYVPFRVNEVEIGYWYILVGTLVIVASTNALNLTGGVEGLSGMLAVVAFGSYGAIALWQEQVFLARFCFTVVGALFGFLWFNIKPAQLVMGNTGTFALGAVLGVVALMTGHWIVLPLIAFIPMMEMVSVILQVGYFRLSKGKRIFRMAPLHYHMELVGWSEGQIVQRFWVINLLFALVGITVALL